MEYLTPRIWIVLLGLAGCYTTVQAQDFSYTQVFAHTSTLNPSLTGLHNGQYKASLLYRNQWIRAVDKPFTMSGGYVDLRSSVPFKSTEKDAFGLGLGFISEKQGLIEYKKNNFNINLAYHKALDHAGLHVLSAGAQLGFLQNSVGYENITFFDQFDGTDFSLPTAEDLPANTINMLDVGAGVHYQYQYEDKLFSAGVSVSHANAPDVSFGNRDESTLDETENILFRKYMGHLYYQVPGSPDLQLTPRIITKIQGPYHLTMAGSTARIRIKGYNESAFHVGLFVQAGNTHDSHFRPISGSMIVGYEFGSFNLGLSYDVGLINQYNFRDNPGNFELSITHFGFLTDHTNAGCPVF